MLSIAEANRQPCAMVSTRPRLAVGSLSAVFGRFRQDLPENRSFLPFTNLSNPDPEFHFEK
jgi:hypothetical protein